MGFGVKSPASALGEAVGKLVEEGVREIIEEIIRDKGLTVGRNKERIRDRAGIPFEINLPIKRGDEYVALIDVKYLRYKKHARDKGSWIVVAHNRLKATYSSIRKTLVILFGPGWTSDARQLIRTSCIDVLEVESGLINRILADYGIEFEWPEKDIETPRQSWEKFCSLPNEQRDEIKRRIIAESEIRKSLEEWVEEYVVSRNNPEEKLTLPYFCPEAGLPRSLDEFTSGKV